MITSPLTLIIEVDFSVLAVHVAVGVVFNSRGEVLIALRNKGQHQGGLWEFPGGKVEKGETVQQALVRELKEEVGIVAHHLEPLIGIPHSYTDKKVFLDVWTVGDFEGEVVGREGQEVCWVALKNLGDFQFPVANKPIILALQLPSIASITGVFNDENDLILKVSSAISKGAGLICYRPTGNSNVCHDLILNKLTALCAAKCVWLTVNSSISTNYDVTRGLHLQSSELMRLKARPVSLNTLLGASCHSKEELDQAHRVGVDYIMLSPVQQTSSHPSSLPMGWQTFAELVIESSIPIFALGGLGPEDVDTARANGAQGIAAISKLWD